MRKSIEEMTLVGFYHFSSKDKKQIYYVVQVLYNKTDLEHANNKANIINIFTTDDVYKKACAMSIGDTLNIEMTPNIENGKIYCKVVL